MPTCSSLKEQMVTRTVDIRESATHDLTEIELLYPLAFPDEDLLPLVRDLLPDTLNVLSLVATIGSQLAGHVVFTRSRIAEQDESAALLGPLAVSPIFQRQGVGGALIRAGLRRLEHENVDRVFVLGDPAYYGRFGFQPGAAAMPPCPLPAEWQNAWQSLSLTGSDLSRPGRLNLPDQWLQPSLWLP